jgi:hypothetical protein
VTHGVGPEFKLQYHKEKVTQKKRDLPNSGCRDNQFLDGPTDLGLWEEVNMEIITEVMGDVYLELQ